MAKKQYLSISPYTKRNLPNGYTQALYIESHGTEYIDTEFVANQNTTARIKFSTTQQSSGGVLVAMQGWRNRGYGVFVNAVLFGASGYDKNGLFGDGAIHDVTLNSNAQCYDNGNLIWTGSVSTFTTPATLTICKSNATAETHEFSKAKIYTCLIYDNDVLTRDYVPCYVDATGEYGLYDMVTQSFYGNKGTGAFSGLRIAKLPEGYTQVEYIESSGTQYINTNFVPNNNTRVVTSIQAIEFNNRWLLGSRTSSTSASFAVALMSTSTVHSEFGAANVTATVSNATARTTVDKNKNVCLFGTVTVTNAATTFNGAYPLYLLTLNNGGSTASKGFVGKMYSCQIYDNDVLVRDYIPCVTTAGVAGLYDIKNNVFYGNAGTGTFAHGEIIGVAFREVIKRYLTIGNTHHKVKKGYLTIGGVHRPFIGGGVPTYYGTVTSLQIQRTQLGGASAGRNAVFAGGYYSDRSQVDAYDSNLTRTTATALKTPRQSLVGASTGEYAVFAGGRASGGDETTSAVSAYSSSLVRSNPSSFSGGATENINAVSFNGYAVFAGGEPSSGSSRTSACAYDGSLARSTLADLSKGRYGAAGAVAGDYALFGGGYAYVRGGTSGAVSTVDAYNKSFTRTSPAALSSARQYPSGVSVGGYALIAGGFGSQTVVDVYDSSLTKSTATPLSVGRSPSASITLGDYAILGGGRTGGSGMTNAVDAYDASLTRIDLQAMPTARAWFAAAIAGDFALFAGGNTGSNFSTASAIVDAYTLV